MPDLQVGRGRRVPGSGAAGLRWPWLCGKAARHSSSYSAAKVDGPSPLRSKSPGRTTPGRSSRPTGQACRLALSRLWRIPSDADCPSDAIAQHPPLRLRQVDDRGDRVPVVLVQHPRVSVAEESAICAMGSPRWRRSEAQERGAGVAQLVGADGREDARHPRRARLSPGGDSPGRCSHRCGARGQRFESSTAHQFTAGERGATTTA